MVHASRSASSGVSDLVRLIESLGVRRLTAALRVCEGANLVPDVRRRGWTGRGHPGTEMPEGAAGEGAEHSTPGWSW